MIKKIAYRTLKLFFLYSICFFQVHAQYTISTYAGGGVVLSGDDALKFQFALTDICVDLNGSLIVSDFFSHVIRKISSDGKVTLVAGNGIKGYSGDGGAATAAKLNSPSGLAIDKEGNIFICDAGNSRIRKVNVNGIISTVAGNGLWGFSGDGGAAVSAGIMSPSSICEYNKNIYFTDRNYIRKVDSIGIISTIAGNGLHGYAGDGGLAIYSQFDIPSGICVDKTGSIYITDRRNHRVRKIGVSGVITTIAGNGFASYSGDGGLAVNAHLNSPASVKVDNDGNIFMVDSDNNRVRKVDTSGFISTVVGNGQYGYSGDNGLATAANSDGFSIAFDKDGNYYIINFSRIRKINKAGIITTIAGNGLYGFSGDGGQATSAEINLPWGISVDKNDNIYIADTKNNRIRKVDTNGVISTMAGDGSNFTSGDGVPAKLAQFGNANYLANDIFGNLYISDFNILRKIDTSGIVRTIAGTGVFGFSGDGGNAKSAMFRYLRGIAVDTNGIIYLADSYNHRIRMITTDGIIKTIAGNGQSGFSGDGGSALLAKLNFPYGVSLDQSGNLFIADRDNNRIRKVNKDGIISTIVGTGADGFSGDGGSASLASIGTPTDVFTDNFMNIYIPDYKNSIILKVDSAGIIKKIAGSYSGFNGDGGPASSALLDKPGTLTIDSKGNVFIADTENNRIRKLSLGPIGPMVSTISATNVTSTSATLNGTVNARGNATSLISIRYSTVKADVDGGNGTEAIVNPSSISGSSATNISANVSGLTPSTTYYFRTSATNSGGNANGATLSFTTSVPTPIAPLVTTELASNVMTTSATLKGTVNPRGSVTTALSIRYSVLKTEVDGGNATLVSVTPSSVSGSSVMSISSSVTGLAPATTYYFRASATTAGGTANGATLSFTTATPIPKPMVVTLTASSIGLNTATINGSVNPNGSNTTQLTLKYSQIKSEIEAGSGTTPAVTPLSVSGNVMTPISSSLFGLLPSTTYFYRASASTPGGTVNGVILSFTTVSKADILVPSAFSPNGDGQNDILIPIVLGIQKFGYFMVLNRWGQVVFETREIGKGWDGNYRGNPQPMDTYSWIVEGVDVLGKTIKKNGGALLVR
jgi:gliding motility-associated-like protein